MNFNTLPNLIALAILVAVFRAISRRGTTERLHLWLTGWILILIHFGAQFVDSGQGTWAVVATWISLDALALASIAFLISVSSIASDHRRQAVLATTIAVPALAYINAAICEVTNRGYYYAVIGVGVIAPLVLFCRYYRRVSLYAAAMVAGTLLTGFAVSWTVLHGDPWSGVNFILAALNFLVAILFWKRYPRITAGVLTSVSGFILWGIVFPGGMLLDTYFPAAKVESEVWNIPKYLVAVGMILTLLEEQIERSKYLAYHDELTGLPNRRLLQDRLEQAVAYAERTGCKLAVLVLDLDHFKEVNDTFGHRIGDLALQGVVKRLAARMRASDTLARSGGDEFTIISDVSDAAGAAVLVSALESALANPIAVEDIQVQIGLSIGVALFADGGRTSDELLANADRAMYKVKRAGRTPGPTGIAGSPTDYKPPYLSAFEQHSS